MLTTKTKQPGRGTETKMADKKNEAVAATTTEADIDALEAKLRAYYELRARDAMALFEKMRAQLRAKAAS